MTGGSLAQIPGLTDIVESPKHIEITMKEATTLLSQTVSWPARMTE